MRPRRVLVTGVRRYLGRRLAGALAVEPGVVTVVGVDSTKPPGDMGPVEFVPADIRNPLLGRVLATAGIDTVVHLPAGPRSVDAAVNAIGTMQLLAACQGSPTVRRLVVKSSASVYGSSRRDPGAFTESAEPRALPRSGYGRDAMEIEGYVRGFTRRRPDVEVTILRFANLMGPRVETALTRYLAMPVVPTVWGFDPRLQLCHEHDALEVLRRAAAGAPPGTYNVAGAGILLLSQAIRRAGRIALPVAPPVVSVAGGLFRQFGLADFSPEQIRLLEHGRILDTARLRAEFGYRPHYSTAETLDDFARTRPGPVRRGFVDAGAQVVRELVRTLQATGA